MSIPNRWSLPGYANASTQRGRISPGSISLAVALLRFHRGLGSRQSRHRHSVRRAADVIQAERVAELDRGGIATVLTADADLHIAPGLTPFLDRDLHQPADPGGIE